MILPGLREFFELAARHPSLRAALESLQARRPATLRLAGLNPTAKALYTALLYKQTDRPVVMLVENGSVAESMTETLSAFLELLDVSQHRRPPFVLPAHDVTPYDGLSPHAEIGEKRGMGLWRMVDGTASIVVTPIRSALLRVAGPDFVKDLAMRVQTADELVVEDLERHLVAVGYERHEPVEMVGQYAVRGGIVDIYPPEAAYPVRIELFGDQVESMREFDPELQKSVQRVDEVLLLPLTEYPSLAEGEAAGSGEGADSDGEMPFLPTGWEFHSAAAETRSHGLLGLIERPLVVWSEGAAITAEAEKHWERLTSAHQAVGSDAPPPDSFYFTLESFQKLAGKIHQIHLEELGLEGPGFDLAAPGGETLHISSQPTPRFKGNIPQFVRELEGQVKSGKRALITVHSPGDVERMADILAEHSVSYQLGLRDPSKARSPYLEEKAYLAGPIASTLLVEASVRAGTALADAGLILYGHEDIFAASELVAKPEKRKSALSTFLADLQDLKEGDLVVHAEHGIGRYRGVKQIEHAGRLEDLMQIEFAEQARLYLPLSRLDLLQKYHGAGGRAPALDRMGGQTWTRTKSRVKARLLDMADELLKLYATRKKAGGFAFSPDSNWQREFEEAFEYTETPDQLTAITDIKRDMESDRPMDRLVCGDVGFGKTEVAMRGLFKALGDGKQAAVLAPTTVLAFQHYETFRQRFAAFPVEIEMLTRFRTARQQKEIIERVAAGKVDILIGTHRLLSKDVTFADLGLLVIDEEQRFGVRHKERLKQITHNVDVLSLTATPIPRTLHMSLVGLRDISVIQTPPRDRLSIQTVVAPTGDAIIRTAIEREVSRAGQVYFIHNRVENIWEIASYLHELVPQARIGVGHGQMPEKELEKVILKFMRHKYDVLLSTTIVENGLDIPLANTILMHNADRYGLAELYQLRGRVGRSNRRAYAYLLVDENAELSSTARKRLAALKEFSELGSGFKIAALDLELRGAGNLLGSEQHGQIAAVGFETYCRLLDETVRKLEGEDVEEAVHASLRLQLDVHIPPDFIADETQRLQAYKRLAEIRTEEEAQRTAAEMRDRYGPLPQPVLNLIHYGLIKSRAERMRIAAIERRRNRWTVRFREDSKVNAEQLMSFVADTPGANFSPQGQLEWSHEADWKPKEVFGHLNSLLDRLALEPAAGPTRTT